MEHLNWRERGVFTPTTDVMAKVWKEEKYKQIIQSNKRTMGTAKFLEWSEKGIERTHYCSILGLQSLGPD